MLAPGIHCLRAIAPEVAQVALPGQFAQIEIPDTKVLLRRPLGIAGCERTAGEIALIYRELGTGTKKLAAMKNGEFIGVLAPLGHGFKLNNVTKPLLVGGGLGLSPLLFLAQYYAQSGATADVLMGGRTEAELFWRTLFEPFAKCHITTNDGSLGIKGFVTELLPKLLSEQNYDYVAICGPEPMMKNVAKMVKEYNIPCDVSLERRMACGLGACLSCVIDTAHGRKKVCQDGPVFAAEEVFL